MKFISKHFIKILLSILIVKFTLLFWSAHPFDFWTFVNQFQRNTLYGWNIFEYWNKGNLLILIWYPIYAFYLKILELFSLRADNLLLLHFLFKIPFLLFDLFTGFLLFKITIRLNNSVDKAKIIFLAWFLNPIIFYLYGIHGTYELLVPFSITLLLFGIVFDNPFLTSTAFVIGFTTKYFLIILMPFVILYLFINKRFKDLFLNILFSAIGLIFSYIQVILDPSLIGKIVNSIFSLTTANSPIGISSVNISPLNIFSFINWIFNSGNLINNNGWVFTLANNGLRICTFILFVHFLYRFYATVVKNKSYEIQLLIKDLLIIIIYFLVFLSNFQPHYLSWIIPLVLIFISYNWNFSLFINTFALYTLIGFIYEFRNEIGPQTFFLDILTNPKIISFNNFSTEVMYREGFLIILMLLIMIFILIRGINKLFKNKYHKNTFVIYFFMVIFTWIIIIVSFSQVIMIYFSQRVQNNQLSYAVGSNYHTGEIFGNFNVDHIKGNRVYFENNDQFSSSLLEQLSKLSKEQRAEFQAYILIKNQTQNENYFINANFNGCVLKSNDQKILDHSSNIYYLAVAINVNCILNKDNVLGLKGYDAGFNLTKKLELYIENKDVKFLYQKSINNNIFILALTGAIYLFLEVVLSIYLLFLFNKHD